VIYQHSIGVTPDQIGVMSGALIFCIAFGALFGGRLGDQFGRRRVFLVTMILIALGSALLTFGTEYPPLLTGVILVGLATGADLPVSLATIAEAATDKNRGAILVLSNILWVVGIISAIAIASVVGGWGRLGGQILYAQLGAVALVVVLLRFAIPESELWLESRDERRRGVETIRADKASLRDLLRAPYLQPFLALLAFYALTNLAMNTGGQFSTYVAVNVANIPVELFSRVTLVVFTVGLFAGIWFMKVVDTPRRMRYFVAGAMLLVAGWAIPAILGFNLATLTGSSLLVGIGADFAFESIMKVWTQESFPTLLRSTAQGTIVAFARVVGAPLAVLTPALIGAGVRTFYLALAITMAVGLAIGWLAFHDRMRNEFDVEQGLDPDTGPQPVRWQTAHPD